MYRIQVIQWELALELNIYPDEGFIYGMNAGDGSITDKKVCFPYQPLPAIEDYEILVLTNHLTGDMETFLPS